MKATDSNLWKEIPHSINRLKSRALDGQEALNRIKTTYPEWYLDFTENGDEDSITVTQVLCTMCHENYGLAALILYYPNNFKLFEFRHNKTERGRDEANGRITEIVNTLKIVEGAIQ